MIASLDQLQRQYRMAKDLGCRPSALAGIEDAYMAYFWDESVWWVGTMELTPKRSDETFGAFG
jgi:hypothetical protein